eukprot:TRINITY_DN2280_c1_g1_i1.p1 TRINITY_DN2280_c1_g1~~TRINITY_DN2280_c1_g1_i1.p1  ORF type:complete len:557 (+),score=108.22 TRINITY_DN2280_c1_g1_i1:122-1792(+)
MKFSGHRPQRREDGRGWMLQAIVLLTIFFVSYRMGASNVREEATKRMEGIDGRVMALAKEQDSCMERVLSKSETGNVSSAKLSDLNAETASLRQATEEENGKTSECQAAIVSEEGSQEATLSANKKLLEDVKKEHATEAAQLKQFSGKSTRMMVLMLALNKLKKEHLQLLVAAGIKPPEYVGGEYLEQIVDRWKKISTDPANKNESTPLFQRLDKIRPVNASAELWYGVPRHISVLDKYDKDHHALSVLLHKKDGSGNWIIPTWKGRVGNTPIKKGAFIKQTASDVPIRTIFSQIRSLYAYTICAIGEDYSDFMFPNLFKSCEDCPAQLMSDYIEVPTVHFCVECVPVHRLPEFKFLCMGNTPELQYGSLLFWRSRSRIKFKSRLLDAAEEWMREEMNWTPNMSLVTIHVPVVENCSNRKETMMFKKILETKVKHLTTAKYEQCAPPLGLVQAFIETTAKQLRVQNKDFKIFISAPTMSDESWGKLRSQLYAHKRNMFRYISVASKYVTTDMEIVDTIIAAKGTHLVFGRYDYKSVQIAEQHMLFNNLEMRNGSVW